MAGAALFRNYVGGEWVESNRTLENRNPADTSVLVGVFCKASAQDLAQAAEAAETAFPGWASAPPPARGALLCRVANILTGKLGTLIIQITKCLILAAAIGGSTALVAQTSYQYTLPSSPDAPDVIYPTVKWLPEPYQKYYQEDSLADTIKLFTSSSLENEEIDFTNVNVTCSSDDKKCVVTIETDDDRAKYYADVHPKFLLNYMQALQGISKCMATTGCWNNSNPHEDEPWAFFPQFGLPMALQRSVLLLNYPPTTALTEKNYLNTFTIGRWSRVLTVAGIGNPTLFEAIVDIRPIAAPGSGTSQYLPDAQTYFNDKTGSTGGYYITPQLNLMLDPPANADNAQTLPVVVLGGPARAEWKAITGLDDSVLDTGTVQLPSAVKKTPYILGNHPDVTTYQCCSGDSSSKCANDNHLIEFEEIDLQVACWVSSISNNPNLDPSQALASCKEEWVTARTPENDEIFCALARTDSNECFGKNLSWEAAIEYCNQHGNNPCATPTCPTQ